VKTRIFDRHLILVARAAEAADMDCEPDAVEPFARSRARARTESSKPGRVETGLPVPSTELSTPSWGVFWPRHFFVARAAPVATTAPATITGCSAIRPIAAAPAAQSAPCRNPLAA
jgi:hypothetical protein